MLDYTFAQGAEAKSESSAGSSSPQGERKRVTVLFADTKASTEMIANRDPEEARSILDPILQAMMDGVYHYDGVVNQIMGDGIMALFGAPIAYEDHAIRACHAALEIRRRVAQHAEQSRIKYGVRPEVRLGLNSGEVVVRTLQNKQQAEYSAVGRTAHIAARLEQIARPGSILISDSTFRAASGLVDVIPLGPTAVKGVEQPVSAFELTAARHLRPASVATGTRVLYSTFAGRASELRTLHQRATYSSHGHGQIVSLVGEPGVGKSRLALEFWRSIESLGWTLVEAGAISYEAQTSYFSISALLKSYFGLKASDGSREIREIIVGRVEGLDPCLSGVVPALLYLLDVQIDDAHWNGADAVTRRRWTIDALGQLFMRTSRDQPVLILLEDLQWIDNESQTALNSLAEVIQGASVMMLVTYRNGYEHAWSDKTYYTQVPVDPLSLTAVDEILDSWLGRDLALAPLKKRLWDRTEGNPLFLEESVKALIETGALIAGQSTHGLALSPDDLEIPSTVHAVLAARIDRVRPEDKALLQIASVVGKDFPLYVLQRMTGWEWERVSVSLLRLQQAELIHETNLAPPEFTFGHALTHEVAYSGLLREQRKNLHAAAVLAIEQAYPERVAENVEALARHAFLGEAWQKALRYLHHAAISATSRSEYGTAARWLRSAIEVLTHLPEEDDLIKLAIDLRFDLHTAIVANGGHARVFEILSQAEELGRKLKDDVRLARIYGYQAMGRWWTADYGKAVETGKWAFEAAHKVRSFRMAAIALIAIGWSHHSRGEWTLARDALTKVLDIARLNPDDFGIVSGLPLPQVLAHSWLARGNAEQGEFDQALNHAMAAVRVSDTASHPWSRAAASHGLGATLILQERLSEAVDSLEQGLHLCEKYEISSWWPAIASLLGYALALNDSPRGLLLLEEVMRQTTLMGRLAEKSQRIIWYAEALLRMGQTGRAAELGREALELARIHQERPSEARALFLLGSIALQTEPPETALALKLYGQASDLAHLLSMGQLIRRCHEATRRI